ncbi:alpha/beta hydrolase [Terribacillus saccharophilus]|uniref:Alpha/beta hydrolase n=1 Tax=Terribacillus saccharophilus TaxID=361277 RepID=A0A268HHG8_9BACI|nr:alpha/beta hydrolase [Terribacillus saccharophilus]PAD36228.1 alpha/beta hydrolase [Terribacillus saccharophilus]PAD96750.1 alpha/beta hydrolase [Terribacillus saccharophilus]PAE00326.1 alpha/beta hydrolase [Terribacillus saccharophilus]PAE09331.1 alpha/beta hydrolase [Terribacillus saccharophilus]
MGHVIKSESGYNIFAEDIGTGIPVVFLHGWPVSHKMFEYQMNELPKHGYRFIGIDLLGFGKSDKPWNSYTYDAQAEAVHAVVEHLGLDNFVLAGFSMGGPIAIRYMNKYGLAKVNKLLLLSAAAPVFTQRDAYPFGMKKEEADDMIEQIQTDRPKTLQDFGNMFFAQDHSEPFKEWFFHLGLEASGHGTIQAMEALRDEDLRAELAQISTPTYIFHGQKDEICPFDFATEMTGGIVNSTIVPFENSGHGLMFDEKEKFNQELLRVLQS